MLDWVIDGFGVACASKFDVALRRVMEYTEHVGIRHPVEILFFSRLFLRQLDAKLGSVGLIQLLKVVNFTCFNVWLRRKKFEFN